MTSRPGVWIGHVNLQTNQLEASAAFAEKIGLRPEFRNERVAIFELRGGTHLIFVGDDAAKPGAAGFDLMVEDLDATYADYAAQGLTVSPIERGQIHDSFLLTEPGGNVITVNSTHVADHSAV